MSCSHWSRSSSGATMNRCGWRIRKNLRQRSIFTSRDLESSGTPHRSQASEGRLTPCPTLSGRTSSADPSTYLPTCSDVTSRWASDRGRGNALASRSGRVVQQPAVSGRASALLTRHGSGARCRSPKIQPACAPSPTPTRTAFDPNTLAAGCRSAVRQTDGTRGHTAHSAPHSPPVPAGWLAIGGTGTAGHDRR